MIGEPPPLPGPAGRFVGERIQPAGALFTLPAAVGDPALPHRFMRRRKLCTVAAVLRTWKERTADRTHGSGKLYTRRHWFELRMDDGETWSVYFERQPVSRRTAKARWWLYQIRPA